MDPTRIGLFDLAKQRLNWVEQRQALLAQNIANANTPSYQARDVRPFAETLSKVSGAKLAVLGPVRTDPAHLAGSPDSAAAAGQAGRPRAKAPDGNAVTLDEQLMKVADTQATQALVTSLYKRYMAMFSTALGRAG